MTDIVKKGIKAQGMLESPLFQEYYQDVIEGLMSELLEADVNDVDKIIEIKRKIDYIRGYRQYLIETVRTGKYAEVA